MPIRILILFMLIVLPLQGGVAGEPQRVQFLGLHSQVPAQWQPEEVSSSMRLLQFRAPGRVEGKEAAFVLYYFGPDQGGSLEDNVERWKSQFSRPDGGEVEAVITSLRGTFPANLVELEGSYARGVGLGPSGEAVDEQMLLAAIVESPNGRLYPQLHGPADLVKTLRDDFVAFIEGIEPDQAR
jgi:hypothetical protein